MLAPGGLDSTLTCLLNSGAGAAETGTVAVPGVVVAAHGRSADQVRPACSRTATVQPAASGGANHVQPPRAATSTTAAARAVRHRRELRRPAAGTSGGAAGAAFSTTTLPSACGGPPVEDDSRRDGGVRAIGALNPPACQSRSNRVGKRRARRETLGRILAERLHHRSADTGRYGSIQHVERDRVFMNDLVHDRRPALAHERTLASQQPIHRHGHGELIRRALDGTVPSPALAPCTKGFRSRHPPASWRPCRNQGSWPPQSR